MSIDLPAGAQLLALAHDVTLLQLDSAACTATLSLLGGQLLSFQPRGQQPWLYISPQALFQPGRAIRGGVPVCWPWFGPHPADSTAPAHGIARQQAWQLLDVQRDGDAFHVKLQGPGWEGLSVVMDYTLSTDVSMCLHTRNDGPAAQTFSAALHSYIAVSDSRTIRLHGVEGQVCEDKVNNRYSRLPAEALSLSGEFDAIVYSTADVVVADPGWRRRLRVSRSGSASVVLWNPWQDKAARLTDLPDDGWRDFVCVEAARAGEDSCQLAAGDSHQLCCRLSLD